jgi:class 3 adenylate cyclase
MPNRNATPEEVLEYARSVQDAMEALRRTVSCVIMFVDLVDSTGFKDKNPSEDIWLPRLAAFLAGVSRIVNASGRVVKYIGDEVMAVFEGPDAALTAEHVAEQVIAFCLNSGAMRFEAKIAIDAGAVTMLDFPDASNPDMQIVGDPQGIVVDRCARIAKRALPNTILASAAVVQQSKSKTRWRSAGMLKPRGIAHAVRVHQLRFAETETPRVSIINEISIDECKKQLAETRRMLEELKALHQ